MKRFLILFVVLVSVVNLAVMLSTADRATLGKIRTVFRKEMAPPLVNHIRPMYDGLHYYAPIDTIANAKAGGT